MDRRAKRILILMIVLCLSLGSVSAVSYMAIASEIKLDVQPCPDDKHITGDKVKENSVPATCEKAESYDVVTYCTRCGKELSREKAIGAPALGHLAGDPVKENVVEASCLHPDSYDLVTRCSRCGIVLESASVVGVKADHTPGEPVKENEVAATCQMEGSYDLVVRCITPDCGQIISSEHKTVPKADHTPGETVKENEVAATEYNDGSYDLVTRCLVCGEELSRVKETIPKTDQVSTYVRAAEEAARQAVEAARQAAEIAARAGAGNMPFEPATTRPLEQPTRPAPAPIPVPAPQRPAAPAAPAGIPSRPAAALFEIAKINDADAFAENLISELAKDGKTPALDAETLKTVLHGVNDPEQEPMGVEEAVEKLGGSLKTYRSNGKEAEDPDLSEYHFLCSFEQLKLQNKQAVDRYGNPQPFEITTFFPALADMKTEEIADTMMMVYDPVSGQTALIRLETADLNTGKNPPELKVTLPFPGLFTFIRK